MFENWNLYQWELILDKFEEDMADVIGEALCSRENSVLASF